MIIALIYYYQPLKDFYVFSIEARQFGALEAGATYQPKYLECIDCERLELKWVQEPYFIFPLT